jgi:catechol 2,3-dioxygenase-like lactoylglutathione lyase family enzyme
MTVKFSATVLFVKDIAASRKFYEDVLEMKVEMDFGANVGFEGGLAIWEKNYAENNVYGRLLEENAYGKHASLEVYFETMDMDKIVSRLDDAGVEKLHPVKEQPWGQRVIRVYDPDHYVIEIGEPMPVVVMRYHAQGMGANEISEKTYMPLEIVNQIIASTQQ